MKDLWIGLTYLKSIAYPIKFNAKMVNNIVVSSVARGKIRLNFSEDLFFLEITCFWAEKAFEFPISAEKSVSISDKLCKSDSKAMKI